MGRVSPAIMEMITYESNKWGEKDRDGRVTFFL